MKKALPIFATAFAIILIFNQILTMALIKPLSEKSGDTDNIGLVMVYAFCIINISLLISIISLTWINNIKVNFICSILMIIFFVLNLISVFIVTWIFGLINIIFGIAILVIAILNLKHQRYLI